MKRFGYLITFLSAFALIFSASQATAAPKMTEKEMKEGAKIYFEECAGCHGVLRKGATGPALEPKKTLEMGTDVLAVFIQSGTAGGMVPFGDLGILNEQQINLMARYIQQEPTAPPEISLADMKATWKVTVPVDKRPTKPAHNKNWQNFFGVVLRDAGQVAIFDGDTKEKLATLNTGFAVHILRVSASGRYLYSIGRDGKATMMDMWMKTPALVAEIKTCSEARSIDTSKYKGFEDKYAVVGCYWPPHLAILDGATLEPLKVVSTRSYTFDTNEYHPEPRVAAIVSSHYSPEWVINVKEAGYIWLVDYSDLANLNVKMIEAERFLHDGGWDATHRYFMSAANARDTMVVIDTKTRTKVAKFKTGAKPHPGRGANWTDPKYGPVTGTVHIGEAVMTVWGSDPAKHKDNAWKVLYKVDFEKAAGVEGGGQLFLKTHPKSKNVWVDFPLNTGEDTRVSLGVMDINDIQKVEMIKLADRGRVVHMEYNKDGDELWVSVWDQKGEIVILDDKTRKVKKRITDLRTPTGKFNIYNTMHDIY
ncbi:MAG: nitrite reductase [Nitrospinota bacterium]|nr:nitrite reductase [Nitrospinota bacterium]